MKPMWFDKTPRLQPGSINGNPCRDDARTVVWHGLPRLRDRRGECPHRESPRPLAASRQAAVPACMPRPKPAAA